MTLGDDSLGGWTNCGTSAAPTCSTSGSRCIPAGVRGHLGAGAGKGRRRRDRPRGLVLQRQFPLAGHGHLRPVIGLWYWCTDQYIVQRALGAPNEQTARRGSIFAAFLKLFPVYLFIIPGLICFALAKSGKVAGLAPIVGADGKAVAARRPRRPSR